MPYKFRKIGDKYCAFKGKKKVGCTAGTKVAKEKYRKALVINAEGESNMENKLRKYIRKMITDIMSEGHRDNKKGPFYIGDSFKTVYEKKKWNVTIKNIYFIYGDVMFDLFYRNIDNVNDTLKMSAISLSKFKKHLENIIKD